MAGSEDLANCVRLSVVLRRSFAGSTIGGLEMDALRDSLDRVIAAADGSIAMTGKQKLVKVLTEAGAPDAMVAAALRGRYDDFESDSATPIIDLVRDCIKAGLFNIAERAKDGEFDAE